MKDETKKKLKRKKEKIRKKNLGIIQEFKDFALRGSVVDMAVGVVIGAAFSAITTSLVNNIILPIVAGLGAGTDFKDLMFHIGSAKVEYGLFLQAIINFFVIAASIFFIIKVFNAILRKPKEAETKVQTELDVLIQIRDKLDNMPAESANSLSDISDAVTEKIENKKADSTEEDFE